MDTIIDFLMTYGYGGMAMAAFVAGSVFPFSSETILAGLQLAGLHPLPLFLSATLGNVLGSMFNYWIGSFGKLEWIERYLHVGRDKVEKTRLWLQGRGAWMGVFCFLPILGSALAVTLGYMRANPWFTLLSITIGKAVRYAILIWAVKAIQT
ncbi:DedA family protein [bacterium]|nr:DedA family protein [bacterium]